jgi:hypothetical protein
MNTRKFIHLENNKKKIGLMAMKSVFGKDWLKTYLNVRLQNFNDHEDP